MSYQDDTPVTSGEVTVRHTFTRDAEGFIETTHEIPASGVVTLDFQPPLDDDVVSLALEARFQELTQWLGEITRAQSPTDAFLQVTLLTQEPKVLPVHVVETDPLGLLLLVLLWEIPACIPIRMPFISSCRPCRTTFSIL